jgi:hypothetical protein
MAERIAAEEYERYVGRMITLGYALAAADANRRECAMVDIYAANAQRALSRASDLQIAFGRLSEVLTTPLDFDNAQPKDITILLSQLFATGQMLACYEGAAEVLKTYTMLSNGRTTTLDGGFDEYSLRWLSMELEGIEINLFDGTYPVAVIGAGVEVFLYSLAISLVFNVLAIFGNKSEADRIEDARNRYERESVKDADYRRLAREAAGSAVRELDSYFVHYEPLAKELRSWIGNVDAQALKIRYDTLHAWTEAFAERTSEIQASDARRIVRAILASQDEEAVRSALGASANVRIVRAIRGLTSASCGDGDFLINSIRADLSLAELMGLDTTKRLGDPAQRAIDKFLARCGTAEFGSLIAVPPLTEAARAFEYRFNEVVGTCVYVGGHRFGSFCENLHSRDYPGRMTQTGPYGGFTQSTGTAGYTLAADSFGLPPSHNGAVWAGLRTLVASNGHLPGQYAVQRGADVGAKLDRAASLYDQRLSELEQINTDLNTARTQYIQDTLSAATTATLHTVKDVSIQTTERINPRLREVLPAPGEIQPSPPTTATTDVSVKALQELSNRLETNGNNIQALWNDLQHVSNVNGMRLQELPEQERMAVMMLQEKFFDDHGILKGDLFQNEWGTTARLLSVGLQSSSSSLVGPNIRFQLNRALVAGTQANIAQVPELGGAIALITAADIASAVSDEAATRLLLRTGTEVLDAVVAFTPAAPVNDALQILYGIATGRDYSGNPMSAFDYATRAIGVVIGIIPGGTLAVRLGGKVVNGAFTDGCRLLRRLNLQGSIAVYFAKTKQLVTEVVRSVGEAFPWESIRTYKPEELLEKVNGLVLWQKELLENGTSRTWLERVWVRLREGGTIFDEGAVKLFDDRDLMRVALPDDGIFARVVPRGSVDEIIAGTRPLSSSASNEAFITAASDLTGLSAGGPIAQRLGLYNDEFGTVLRELEDHVIVSFKVTGPGLASPVNFDRPFTRLAGWMYGGITKGGAREWIIDADARAKGAIEFVGFPRRIVNP